MTGKNVTITDKIIGNFSDYIRDVSSRASNMLEQRGYSDETIYSQIIEIKQLIAKIQSSKEEQEIFECLEQSDKNIKEITFAVGYNSQTYFCKVFKKIVGISASEYKAGVRPF